MLTTLSMSPSAQEQAPDTDIEEVRTRAEAEAEIAALNEEIEWWRDLVKDDIERLEAQRDEIEEGLDDLPDEEAIVEHCLTLANGDRDTALELAPSYVGGSGEARRAALARVAIAKV